MKNKSAHDGVSNRFSMMPVLLCGIFMVCAAPVLSFAQGLDPCPMPKDLAQKSPPDMAAVQADIDILKICVERANLLRDLEELDKKSSDDSSAEDAMLNNLAKGSLSSGSDKLFDLPEGNGKMTHQVPDTDQDLIMEDPRPDGMADYRVVSIGGLAGKGFRAKISGEKIGEVTVLKGDRLDENTVVSDISANGVILDYKGEKITAEWK